VDGVLYCGFVNVLVCKTCRALHIEKGEVEAFARDVGAVAAKTAPEGEPPRKIRRRAVAKRGG
jgi:hypothetical protein